MCIIYIYSVELHQAHKRILYFIYYIHSTRCRWFCLFILRSTFESKAMMKSIQGIDCLMSFSEDNITQSIIFQDSRIWSDGELVPHSSFIGNSFCKIIHFKDLAEIFFLKESDILFHNITTGFVINYTYTQLNNWDKITILKFQKLSNAKL